MPLVEQVPVEGALELGAVVGLDRPRPGTAASRGRSRGTGSRSSGRCGGRSAAPGAGCSRRSRCTGSSFLRRRRVKGSMNFTSTWTRGRAAASRSASSGRCGACSAARRAAGSGPRRLRIRQTPGVADLDVVVALQVHRDLLRAEVVVLAQVDDLADDFGLGRVRASATGAEDRSRRPPRRPPRSGAATCRSTCRLIP